MVSWDQMGEFQNRMDVTWQVFKTIFVFYSHGKTTLLKHIASRSMNIPANIDILLCEQGALTIWKWSINILNSLITYLY